MVRPHDALAPGEPHQTPSQGSVSALHVGILTHNLEGGAMANLALRYGRSLLRARCEVDLIHYAGDTDLDGLDPAFAVFDLETGRARRSIPSVARYVGDRRPDALLFFPTYLNLVAIVSVQLARHTRAWDGLAIPVLTHPIALAQRESLKDNVVAARLLYPLADGFVSISPGPAEEIGGWRGVDPAAIHVVPPPIDVPEEPTRVGTASRDGPLFVTCSRLVPIKRHDLLLLAFARVRERDPRAHLVIIGVGPAEGKIRQQITKLNLVESVSLLGHVEDPRDWMRRATGFVLASDEEGFGQVLIEAMSVGCPAISTDALGGGPRYVLEGGRSGSLVPRGDAEGLSRAMIDLMEPDARRRWSEIAHTRAQRFSLPVVGEDLRGAIQELAGRKHDR